MSDPSVPPARRLDRPGASGGALLGGVCQGVADHLGWDVLLLRVALVVLTLLGGSGVLVYLVLWVVMPSRPAADDDVTELPSDGASLRRRVGGRFWR